MVLLDGSKILLSSDMYEKLQIKGLRFEVADALQLLGVTINLFSAYGFHFDKDEFGRRCLQRLMCLSIMSGTSTEKKKVWGISMIQLTYEQKNSIGLQYILDRLNPSSPYGQERVRRMTPYTVEEKIF